MSTPKAPGSKSAESAFRRTLSKWAGLVRRNLDNFRYGVNRYCLQNPSSRRRFLADQPGLNAIQRKLVADLRTKGIGQVSLNELFPPGSQRYGDEIVNMAEQFATSDTVKKEEQKFRAGEHRGVAKNFIIKRYEPGEIRTKNDPLFRFGLCSEILDVVNSYAGLWSRYYDVEMLFNIALGTSAARMQSQNWHRDFTDEPTIKVFLYIREVDDAAGPLEYIPGSRRNGPYANLWPQPGWQRKEGWYPPLDLVENTVPAADRVKCCVPAQTLVFCDTSGLHRGGYAVSSPRLACAWTYLTPAALEKRRFLFETGPWVSELDAAARFALA